MFKGLKGNRNLCPHGTNIPVKIQCNKQKCKTHSVLDGSKCYGEMLSMASVYRAQRI